MKIVRQSATYQFDRQVTMSEGVADTHDVRTILLAAIPGALKVERANLREDKNGTDYWVIHERGDRLSIDLKARDPDFGYRPCPKCHRRAPAIDSCPTCRSQGCVLRSDGKDDLALETWSVVDKVPGWTRNPRKRSDYILWVWNSTGRWCLIPFPMLCAWKSECIFVPRVDVWAEIYNRYSGHVHSKPL